MLRKSLASYLLLSSKDSGRRRSSSRRRGPQLGQTYLPRMEALEDRLVMSTMSVVNLDDSGPGSLRQAIEDANSSVGVPDVIEFAPGLQGTISLTSGELDITDDLTINGPGQGKLTVSGSGQSRVFDVSDTSLAISKLRIADGHGVFDGSLGDGGGGIRANASDVRLEHVTLEDNRFEGGSMANITGGGALRAADSSIRLDHVTARNNEAANLVFIGLGGAVTVFSSTLHVSHSDFYGNRIVDARDVWGGAIGSRESQTVISHSRFIGNEADGIEGRGRGGAVMATTGPSSLDVDNSIFIGNSAIGTTAQGGAIVAFQGVTTTLSGSLFVGNSAMGELAQGGAIWNSRDFGGVMTIDDCFMILNRAVGEMKAEGGVIYNGTDAGSAKLTITDTYLIANRAIGSVGGATGIGGGVFNSESAEMDDLTRIVGNKASTSHDDVFGDLTLLDSALGRVKARP